MHLINKGTMKYFMLDFRWGSSVKPFYIYKAAVLG